jgi:hypothetical protein
MAGAWGVRSPIYFLVPTNIVTYIRQCHIPRFLHRLTKKYNLYLSVMKVCSLVITDGCFMFPVVIGHTS